MINYTAPRIRLHQKFRYCPTYHLGRDILKNNATDSDIIGIGATFVAPTPLLIRNARRPSNKIRRFKIQRLNYPLRRLGRS